jgi:hypothetical protein
MPVFLVESKLLKFDGVPVSPSVDGFEDEAAKLPVDSEISGTMLKNNITNL